MEHIIFDAIDISLGVGLSFTSREEVPRASILCEVPEEGGDQESPKDYHEEREASDSGCMPQLRDKSIQNR